MGYHSARRRLKENTGVAGVERVAIALVVVAVVGLIVWMIATAGGGVLMN